mgnify:FL=1
MRSFQQSKNIVVDFARQTDDEALKELLRDMPMPGDISIAFGREPSFFRSACVEVKDTAVFVGRTQENEIIGMGTRSEKHGYVNGQLVCFGYLSDLRLKPEYRSLSLLGRGFRLFKEVHSSRDAKLYLATITDENIRAEKVLLSGRGGLPSFRDHGELRTFVLRPAQFRGDLGEKPFAIRRANESDVQALLRFLNKNGPKRQFFPMYEADDFVCGLLQGLKMEDVFLAIKNEEIIGSLGFWDQSSYKQNIVHRYSRRLKNVRWVFNAHAFLVGRPLLAKENTILAVRTGAICCVKDDDKNVLRALLRHGLAEPRFKKIHFVVLSFHEKDPLIEVVEGFRHFVYRSRLYVIHWEDGKAAHEALDGRVPYVELGGL